METITITKKEYRSLVFAGNKEKKLAKKKSFWHVGFGVLTKIPSEMSSVDYVRKLRKAWR